MSARPSPNGGAAVVTDADEIRRSILAGVRSLWNPGCVMELRALNTKQGTRSGYFDDAELLASAAYDLDRSGVPAVYVTMNPIDESLLALAPNVVRVHAKVTTQDSDISQRTHLLIDLDAKRKSGISATDSEHQAALDRACDIREYLEMRGWGLPLFVDSGNGSHLVYPVDRANDREAADDVRAVLRALAKRWDDEVVEVDQSVFNAARIVKLPGTMARKGFNMPDRPHRRSRIIAMPGDEGATQ